MCSICGLPGYLRCNCESAQPFCDQCAEDTRCSSKIDAQCVIYHFETDTPSQLTCLGIVNGANLEDILETIDDLICNSFNIPFEPVDTESISWEPGGPAGHKPQANVIISPDAGNLLVIRENGVFAEGDGKVKVDIDDEPDYLENQIEGGSSPSGVITNTVVNTGGLLQIIPSINFTNFADAICDDAIAKAALAECLITDGLSVLDTASIDLTLDSVGYPLVLSADVNISAAVGNTLVENVDGLYAAGGSSFVINNNADNRIITANGLANEADAEATLTYDNVAGVLNAPLFTPVLPNTNPNYLRSAFNAGLNLTQANYGVRVGNLTGLWGGIQYASQINTTFGRGYYIGGAISEPAFNTTNGSTSTGLLASMVAKVDIFGNGNYTQIANIRTNFPATDGVLGGVYTGTITNYYSLFQGDINTDEGGITLGTITNKYAIFQEGSSLLNSFATAVVVTSDARIKTNIESYNRGLAEIEKLNTVKYNFKEAPNVDKKVGVLAQDVEMIIPEAVKTENNSFYGIADFKKLDNDVLVYTLINAIKELSQKVKDLEAKLG